jgi:hypothetical protein
MGDRKESRLGENIGKTIMSSLSFLIPTKYKPIHAIDVAIAMKTVAKKSNEGYFVYTYTDIFQLINSG